MIKKRIKTIVLASALTLAVFTAEAETTLSVRAESGIPVNVTDTQTVITPTPEVQATDPTQTTEAAEQVNPVLAKCLPVYSATVKKLMKDFNLAKKKKLNYKNAFDKAMISSYSSGSKLVYSIYDVNDDGTPELVAGLQKGKKLYVFSIYTYYKKKSVCITKDQSAFTWRICKNGFVLWGSKNNMSSYSSEVVNASTLPKGKKELKQSLRLWKTVWVQKGAKNSRYLKHTFKGKLKYTEKTIDEKTYKKEVSKFKDIKLDYYQADNNAVAALKNGTVSAEGAASQKLKAVWK